MNKQTRDDLIEQFGTEGLLSFSQTDSGAIRANVTTPTCTAEIYMQGAHLTQWQPAGQKPVLFLSERSAYESGKAIRGGVPLIFPWFGPHAKTADASVKYPSHGFARTSNDWLLVDAGPSKDDFMMTFELTDSDHSRSFGYDKFKLIYKVAVGEELELELILQNNSSEPMHIEEAFHTYFAVSDAEQITLTGLKDTDYLDKTDNSKRKKQTDESLKLTGETDRPYVNSQSKIVVEDQAWNRKISIDKLNSQSTVIWNPWKEQTAKLSDMDPNGWQQMVCVETANLAENFIEVPAGMHHAMHARVKLSAT